MSVATLRRYISPLNHFVYLLALTVLIQAPHMMEHVVTVQT